MAEYVNREEALEILSSRTAPWNGYQKVRDLPSADVVERTLFDERMAEYQEALDKANEKLAYITGTDDYHYDLEYGREQLNSYVSALVYEKSQERKKGEWIPVTERLPENIDKEVLVCNSEYGKSDLGFITVAIYDGSDWLECWQRKTYLAAVTHWMPLPEQPEEET